MEHLGKINTKNVLITANRKSLQILQCLLCAGSLVTIKLLSGFACKWDVLWGLPSNLGSCRRAQMLSLSCGRQLAHKCWPWANSVADWPSVFSCCCLAVGAAGLKGRLPGAHQLASSLLLSKCIGQFTGCQHCSLILCCWCSLYLQLLPAPLSLW